MKENVGIRGYRDLTPEEVALMNTIKDVEVQVGALWRSVTEGSDCDRRWTAIAKTHFQEGFTALIRSVAKPEDVF